MIKQSIERYTDGDHIGIRQAGTGESKDERLVRDAKNLEDHIAESDKYKGTLYRGIDANVKDFDEGDKIDMRGISSWTKDGDKAENYITEKGGVIFKVDSSRAVDISKQSQFPTEKECIYSAKQNFEVSKVVNGGKYPSIVYLREL